MPHLRRIKGELGGSLTIIVRGRLPAHDGGVVGELVVPLAERSQVAHGLLGAPWRRLRNRVTDLGADYAYLRVFAQMIGPAQAIEDGS